MKPSAWWLAVAAAGVAALPVATWIGAVVAPAAQPAYTAAPDRQAIVDARRDRWFEIVDSQAISPSEDVRRVRVWEPVTTPDGRALDVAPIAREYLLYRDRELGAVVLIPSK